jgi:hypothetical protein
MFLEVITMQSKKATAPCIIGEGTLFNKRDMIRALETLENVKYSDLVDNKVVSKGEGIVIKVFASKENATLVVNEALFINVLSFKYLHFSSTRRGETVLELINDSRVLQLIPQREDSKTVGSRLNRNVFPNREVDYDEEEICASILDDLMEEEED